MAATRALSSAARDAADLLGTQVRAGRARRGWTQADLAERAQVTLPTVRRVETGHPGVALGTALECAVLVGVPLFYEDERRLAAEAERGRAALMGTRVRRPPAPEVDLDF